MKTSRLVLQVLAVALGVAAAEGFTRATIASDAMFEIAFSPGAKMPSEKFGFVYTPHFDGYMRHPDKVWGVPMKLDRHGFRLPATTPGTMPPERRKVALISGRSMTMSYGLPDQKTIHAQMVAESEQPLEVHTTGWAGFDPFRSWHYYLDTLDRALNLDVALFCINPGAIEQYATLPTDLGTLETHPLHNGFFYMLPSNIRMPKDALEKWMGPNYFRSYVLYGLLRYRQFLPEAFTPKPKPKLKSEPDDALTPADGRSRFAEFMRRMSDHFASRGRKFGVVFLVSPHHPLDCYAPFEEALPSDIPRIDLQQRLRAGMLQHEFIGSGHYNGRHANLIAIELNEFVDRILDE